MGECDNVRMIPISEISKKKFGLRKRKEKVAFSRSEDLMGCVRTSENPFRGGHRHRGHQLMAPNCDRDGPDVGRDGPDVGSDVCV